ncbi:chaperonin: PROVISIONAL [Gigaspora margarita]|uniref:Chaperonin: PROVISIONAL n=1 Tax=Gigaspora margarita TaxID=4874 RepID=A0A8H3X4A8_GIGMA|nr:chaperonin: PROVISIONAL [Gigaspora margarita]
MYHKINNDNEVYFFESIEYNIRSEDNSINEAILASLKDLDSTFFVEHSDSEDKDEFNSISDDELESDDDISSNKLNEFKFIDIPDSYIENKIYNNLKSKVKQFFEKGKCLCHSKQSCFSQIGYEKFLARQAEFESLEKNMRDMVIKGQLAAFQKNKDTKKVVSDDRKNVRFRYCYNDDVPVCLNTYLTLVGVSRTYLDNIKRHLQEHGFEERRHGNTSRAPKNINRIEVNYEIARDLYKFLKNYSNIHGMPSPGRHCNKISMLIVFLPTSFNYASVYQDYIQAYKDKHGSDTRIISESTFTNIWKSLIPSLQFMSAKSDLCETSTEDGKRNSNIVKSHISFKTFDGCAHIAYDWAQNMQIPYSLQQIRALYFKRSQKVHLFGICNTSNFPHTQQINYIIDEAKMPDDGKQGKGIMHPGVISYKDSLKDNYANFTVRSFSFNVDTLPSILGVRPLSLKRQEELHKEIAPYIDLPFRDITCPQPKVQK